MGITKNNAAVLIYIDEEVLDASIDPLKELSGTDDVDKYTAPEDAVSTLVVYTTDATDDQRDSAYTIRRQLLSGIDERLCPSNTGAGDSELLEPDLQTFQAIIGEMSGDADTRVPVGFISKGEYDELHPMNRQAQKESCVCKRGVDGGIVSAVSESTRYGVEVSKERLATYLGSRG